MECQAISCFSALKRFAHFTVRGQTYREFAPQEEEHGFCSMQNVPFRFVCYLSDSIALPGDSSVPHHQLKLRYRIEYGHLIGSL
jgi:hypothetical protein